MSKKNVTAIISGAGWIGSFADGLIKELRKRRVSEEAIHSLVNRNGELPIGKIADVLAEMVVRDEQWAKNIFSVYVDYSRPLQDAINAGNYDWANDDITQKHFPTKRSGTANLDIELVHFDKDMSTDEVLAELDKKGLRPAELHELLALGEKHPDLQREFPIIALGSVWRSLDGFRYCPYLFRGGSKRNLDLDWIGSRWSDSCRFAAVRK